MIVSRENILTKKQVRCFPNNSHTAHKYSDRRNTMGCESNTTTHKTCKTSTTDTSYVRGAERLYWPQYNDVNNSNNKHRLCREPSTIPISTIFRLTLLPCLYQFPLRSKPAVTNEKWAHLSPFFTICQAYQSRFPSLNTNSYKFYIKKIQFVPQQRTIVSTTNTNQLRLFGEITGAHCENGMKQGKYTA